MSHTTHHPATFHSNSKVPSQLTSTLTQENSPELSSAAAKKVSPERRIRESEASSSQPQTTKEHEDIESSSQGDHLKRTSPSITTAATAGQGQRQGQVEYSDYNNKVYTLSPPERRDYSIFPSTPQYDPTLLDISEPLSPFFRSSPRVTPSRYIPSVTGPHRSSLPPPKYNMNPTGDIDSIRHVGEDSVRRVGGGGGGGGGSGLDQIIRASESTDFESLPARGRVVVSKNSVEGTEGGESAEDKDNSTPPRGSTLRNGKVTVVSPPEGEVPRKGNTNHRPTSGTGYDLPNVPDSPYGPPGVYPPYQHGAVPYYPPPPPPHGAYPYPPSFHRSANYTADGMEAAMDPERYHHSYYYSLPYGYGYDRPPYEAEMFRGTSSLGKRKRMQDPPHDDRVHEMEQEISEDYSSGLPPRHYYERDRQPSYRYYRPPVSESFESSSDSGSKQRRTRTGPTSIAKAPSYPPPPSSNRYGTGGADSSAASYPGARRSSEHGYNGSMIHPSSRLGQGGLPDSYGNVVRYPPRYEDSSQGYPPPQDLYSRPIRGYAGPSSGRYVEDTAHYFPHGETTSPVQKPLRAVHSEDMEVSPLSSAKRNIASNVPASSLKEGGSPSKAKASTTAQAAIAAGMTEPSSAKEVDFDITAPPSEPITPASSEPICTSSSELNEDDVLCGRGGGTNTQVGNRKFRSLVQEFQPTYLLCRRKEKPQIARTIVLIIRKRGGRFLKKNEDDGTFFEVGDEKAEAKTCQALREGLDVRATKSTIDGRKKSGRARHKKKESLQDGRGSDTVHSETESPRRDGPPGPYYEMFPYAQPPPPPQYYYGPYDPYYPPPPPPFDAVASPHSYSPRKRVARFLPSTGGDAPYTGDYHPSSPYKQLGYHQYLPEQHSSQRDLSREEANTLTWEMEFSPPRSSIVKK